jgi:hypothetical protein
MLDLMVGTLEVRLRCAIAATSGIRVTHWCTPFGKTVVQRLDVRVTFNDPNSRIGIGQLIGCRSTETRARALSYESSCGNCGRRAGGASRISSKL